jgi:hypothetical protein
VIRTLAPVRKLVASLPASLLQTKPPEQVLEELVHLAALPEGDCLVRIGWQTATSTLAVTVGTREGIAPGIFHRLAGALSSLRLGILAADIHTFGDGLVLDHFSVSDPDFHGEPPGHRLREIEEAIRRSLEPSSIPSFRRVWAAAETAAARPATRVRIDNESSDTTTCERRSSRRSRRSAVRAAVRPGPGACGAWLDALICPGGREFGRKFQVVGNQHLWFDRAGSLIQEVAHDSIHNRGSARQGHGRGGCHCHRFDCPRFGWPGQSGQG